MRRPLTALAALALAAPLLTGCGAANDTATPADRTGSGVSDAAASRTAVVTLDGGWAKAGTDMTGMFGTLTNHGDTDLIISGLSGEAAAHIEMHEVTSDGIMQAIAGDVVIPAGGTLELAPGATHIMLMQLAAELHAGDEITVQLTLSDGTTVPLTALVKNYSGANESYDDLDANHEDHSDHKHGDTGHSDDAGH